MSVIYKKFSLTIGLLMFVASGCGTRSNQVATPLPLGSVSSNQGVVSSNLPGTGIQNTTCQVPGSSQPGTLFMNRCMPLGSLLCVSTNNSVGYYMNGTCVPSPQTAAPSCYPGDTLTTKPFNGVTILVCQPAVSQTVYY